MPSKPRKNGNRPRKAGRNLQRRGQQYNLSTRSSPVYAPPFPTEFSVALRSNTVSTVAASSATRRYNVALLEYVSYDPLNLVQFYTMYEFSKITAIEVHYEISNYGTTPIVCTSAVVPWSQFATVAPTALATVAKAKNKIIGGLVGKVSLRQKFPAEHYLGNVAQSSQYWIDSAQSNSLTPVSVEEPTHLLTIEATPGNNMSYTISATVIFHIQFFQPICNAL